MSFQYFLIVKTLGNSIDNKEICVDKDNPIDLFKCKVPLADTITRFLYRILI